MIELLRVHETLERNRIISISGLSNDIIKRMIRNGILKESESFVEVDEKIYLETNIDFTQEQNYAMEKISTSLKQQKVTLIDGITGSGKTELYLEAATRILKEGKQVLIMLPEITLTQEFLKILEVDLKIKSGNGTQVYQRLNADSCGLIFLIKKLDLLLAQDQVFFYHLLISG